jgi:hypothetical protein
MASTAWAFVLVSGKSVALETFDAGGVEHVGAAEKTHRAIPQCGQANSALILLSSHSLGLDLLPVDLGLLPRHRLGQPQSLEVLLDLPRLHHLLSLNGNHLLKDGFLGLLVFFFNLLEQPIEIFLLQLDIPLNLQRQPPHLETDQSSPEPHRLGLVLRIDKLRVQSDAGSTSSEHSLNAEDALEREGLESLVNDLLFVVSSSTDRTASHFVVLFVGTETLLVEDVAAGKQSLRVHLEILEADAAAVLGIVAGLTLLLDSQPVLSSQR